LVEVRRQRGEVAQINRPIKVVVAFEPVMPSYFEMPFACSPKRLPDDAAQNSALSRKKMTDPGNSTDNTADNASQRMKIPVDAALLREIGHGREQAFRTLVDRHGRYLYRVAFSLIGNEVDAEDLVQETFAAVLEASFRGESSVRTWMVAILVRRAAMMRRTRSRRIQAVPMKEHDAPQSSSSGSTDARIDVMRMLEELSPEHREVIVLRELQQMSYEEMATVLDVPKGTVESRLFRAREELRKRFKSYGLP
jgi:RNA polymerase sigma-70 factor (ECF subfamily)